MSTSGACLETESHGSHGGPRCEVGARWSVPPCWQPCLVDCWSWPAPTLQKMEKWGVLHLSLAGNKHSAIHHFKTELPRYALDFAVISTAKGCLVVNILRVFRMSRSGGLCYSLVGGLLWRSQGTGHGIEDPTTSPFQELISARGQGNLYLINSRLFSGKMLLAFKAGFVADNCLASSLDQALFLSRVCLQNKETAFCQ